MHLVLKPNESITIRRVGSPSHMLEVRAADVVLDRIGLTIREIPLLDPPAPMPQPRFDADDARYVRINLVGKQFAYQNRDGAHIGDHVVVRLPGGDLVVRPVVGMGKGSYTGTPYKAACLVPEEL